MAWSYADYESQATIALRVDRLRRHISEVSQEMGPNTETGEHSRDNSALVPYLTMLQKRLAELTADLPGELAGSARARSSFTRGRAI